MFVTLLYDRGPYGLGIPPKKENCSKSDTRFGGEIRRERRSAGEQETPFGESLCGLLPELVPCTKHNEL